jgi:glycosyltransferase involved in cell wall biosynthesis
VRKKLKLISDGYKEIRNEIKLIKKADALTAVSEVDAKYYSSLVARNNVTLAYNVINASEYNPTKVIEPKKYLIITGSFGHYDSPMDHGTRWFIQKVWPIIKPKVPDLSLRIVGKNSDVVWSDMHAVDIDVYGWVSDTKPHIAGAVACVVPLWFESGTRYKILEAGILKTPVVSTSLGAEGLIVTEEIELLIADYPEDFARQILRIVCTDIGKDLSTNMYNTIVAKYSIKSLEQQVAKAIDLVSTKN